MNNAFDKLFSPYAKAQAKIWKNQPKKCFLAAKAGNELAIVYTYLRCINVFKSKYEEHFKNSQEDIQTDIALLSVEALLEALDFLVLEKMKKYNILSYVVWKANLNLEVLIQNYIKENLKQGFTGKLSKDLPSLSDFENSTIEIEGPSLQEVDELESALSDWKRFVKSSEFNAHKKDPTFKDLLKYYLNVEGEFNVDEAAAVFEVSSVTIRTRFKELGVIMKLYGIDRSSMETLFKEYGYLNLLKFI